MFGRETIPGDSGGPVWDATTGRSVGLVSAGIEEENIAYATPLLQPRGFSVEKAPGIFGVPGMSNLQLEEAP
jgi:hypothetical protein